MHVALLQDLVPVFTSSQSCLVNSLHSDWRSPKQVIHGAKAEPTRLFTAKPYKAHTVTSIMCSWSHRQLWWKVQRRLQRNGNGRGKNHCSLAATVEAGDQHQLRTSPRSLPACWVPWPLASPPPLLGISHPPPYHCCVINACKTPSAAPGLY